MGQARYTPDGLHDALGGVVVPLLSPSAHDCTEYTEEGGASRLCKAWQEQVTCMSCHSNYQPPPM